MKKLFISLFLFGAFLAPVCAQFVSVTDKDKSISGDKHNYESLSIYWWPDTTKADGLPYIAKDGKWNPEWENYDLPRLTKLVSNLQNSAIVFAQKDDMQAYNDFIRQLKVWFINRKTKMNPNFEYSQFIPGRNNGKGNPPGMIDTRNLVVVLNHINTVNAKKPIDKKVMKKIKKWYADFGNWMETSDYGKTACGYENNQGISYDYTLYNFYKFTGKTQKLQKTIERFYGRIQQQIKEDGAQPLELKRTKPKFYSQFNLSIMKELLQVLEKNEEAIPTMVKERISKAENYAKALPEDPAL